MSSKTAPESAAGGAGSPWSLAARLTAWYAASAFALILVVTVYLYWALAASLDREDDATLARKVQVLRAVLSKRPGDAAALRQESEWVGEGNQAPKVLVRVLEGGGRSLVQTPGMAEALPTEVFPAPGGEDDPPGRGVALRSTAGRPFRVLAARGHGAPGSPPVILQVALDRSQEEELIADYRRSVWSILAVALVVCAVGGYHIARRGIRPVEEITATARRIRPSNLGERLATAGLPAELHALAATFNGMLARLEESFARLARFSADIAHELRTPVNNLRGEVEVALGRPRTLPEYRDALGSCLEECDRLSRLIDSLLFLARSEHPQASVAADRLDVATELATVRDFFEAAAAEAAVRLAVAASGPVPADLDRGLFQRAVGNLVANALAHTPPGGTVTLTARGDERSARVEVTDTGCGIPAGHLPHIFDRFYRIDPARRSGERGNVGLGLAIAKSIVELHGGSAEITSEVGRGTTVALRFPRLPGQLRGIGAAGPADKMTGS